MSDTQVNRSAVIIAVVVILVAAGGIIAGIIALRPEAEKEAPPKIIPAVEVMTVGAEDVQLAVRSQGTVEPQTETEAASEVAGRVVSVSPNFEVGGGFNKDDVLLEIDPVDYEAALADAEAALADAQLALELEQAKAEQAEREWQKLGSGEASRLTRREPQLASAEARAAAAKAAVTRARRDLDQTKLRAPYDGRVRSTATDLGSFVMAGSPLAELYATDTLEVRLPLSIDDYRFVKDPRTGEPVRVALTRAGDLTGQTWMARVARIDGEIDRSTRSIHLIAEIDRGDALAIGDDDIMAPGLFVEAAIEGKLLENVTALPRRAMIEPGRVLVITPESTLEFRDVTVARAERDRVLISKGLQDGELVSVTNLAAPVEGMLVNVVRIIGEADDESAPPAATKTEADAPAPRS